ncbi:PadR family transcriptional regulator [Caproiciproducens sp. NJN-50]|uniref:PadR family transcriptional regulator n=1 Tax=Caproiciproducens sp. NJN-50 TaxID=2507162 RepID=UPI0013E8AA78|nr:PadR family transcriptional regulator [Caproiciproducens sp. NJN-50]
MSLKHGLLGILNYGSMTGYDLNKVFEDSLSFFWKAQQSQIYRELASLERLGLISSELVVQDGRPNKKVYRITGEGRKELDSWLRSGLSDDLFIKRSGFLMKVFFSGELRPEETARMLRAYLARCEAELKAMEQIPAVIEAHRLPGDRPEKALCWRMTALYGLDYYRMQISWAKKAIAELEAGQ